MVGTDVEPYSIVAGNPAKLVRKRFDDELIDLMEELKWWDLDLAEIKELIPMLTLWDLDEAKKTIKARLGR